MSYQLRSERVWPLNMLARYIWQFLSILEDLNELTVAAAGASEQRSKVTFVRYSLVALHAFDELAKAIPLGHRLRRRRRALHARRNTLRD